MSVIIDRIEIEDQRIKAQWSDDEKSLVGGIIEWNYDEDSAIALAVDLLARLIITEEAEACGVSIGPANGEAVPEID